MFPRQRPSSPVCLLLSAATGLALAITIVPTSIAQSTPSQPAVTPQNQSPDREGRQDRDRNGDNDRRRDGERRGGFGGPGGGFGAGGGMAYGLGWLAGGLGRTMQPEFIRRDLVTINQSLDLDKAQRDIVENILLDYESEYELAAEAMREKFGSLRPANADTPEAQARQARRRELMDEMRSLRDELRQARERQRQESQPATDTEARAQLGETDQRPAEQIERDQIRDRFEKMRAEMEELRPPMPSDEEMQSLLDRASQMSAEWQSRRRVMRETFTGNLQSVLIPAQIEALPAMERALRREKALPRGRISGESANLFFLVRDFDAPAEVKAELEPMLDEYAIALDESLVRRDRHVEESANEFLLAMRDRNVDRAVLAARRESELRVAVREVNDTHAERLASAMSENLGAAFRLAYRQEAYRRVYRDTSMQRVFNSAKAIEGLDPTTLQALQSIEQSYLAELESQNQRMYLAIRRQEQDQFEQRVRMLAARLNGEEPQRPDGDTWREIMEGRRDLNERYTPQLQSVLTPEQFEQLPGMGRDLDGRDGPRDGWRGPGRNERNGRGFGEDGEIGQRRRRMIDRFDADRDGRLNAAEQDAARRQMESDAGG